MRLLSGEALQSVLIKRRSKNIQQSYRRTPVPICDFNNVALYYAFPAGAILLI